MPTIHDEKVIVKENRKLNPHYYLLTFESSRFADELKPGQFLNLKLGTDDCFLRRPFSIYDIRGNDILILYMVVGRGTQFMANLQPGNALEALGSLGNGFQIPDPGKEIYILSGGTGIGSVYLLYRFLRQQNYTNLLFATGFRNSEFVFDELDDPQVVIYTEDGSAGRKGYVTDILDEVLADPTNKMVYACGPHGMLGAVYERLKHRPCPVQLSLEETMACGVGACLGCVAETTHGRETVCKSGPIFNLENLPPLFQPIKN